MSLQLDAYLDRIGYDGALAPDLATLTALHRHHLLAIPYENLELQLGRELTLDIDAIYEKIVRRGRGGWCYEMNGLLAWALRTIGFRITQVAGGVLREEYGDTTFGSHLALLVHLDRDYLAEPARRRRTLLRFFAGARRSRFARAALPVAAVRAGIAFRAQCCLPDSHG